MSCSHGRCLTVNLCSLRIQEMQNGWFSQRSVLTMLTSFEIQKMEQGHRPLHQISPAKAKCSINLLVHGLTTLQNPLKSSALPCQGVRRNNFNLHNQKFLSLCKKVQEWLEARRNNRKIPHFANIMHQSISQVGVFIMHQSYSTKNSKI